MYTACTYRYTHYTFELSFQLSFALCGFFACIPNGTIIKLFFNPFVTREFHLSDVDEILKS